jgi:hypothetical protein
MIFSEEQIAARLHQEWSRASCNNRSSGSHTRYGGAAATIAKQSHVKAITKHLIVICIDGWVFTITNR